MKSHLMALSTNDHLCELETDQYFFLSFINDHIIIIMYLPHEKHESYSIYTATVNYPL